MDSKITYHRQVSYCGKPRCRRCREGTGHGPYWYAYQTINGRTVRTYVGKELPAGLQDTGAGEDSVESGASEIAGAVVRLYVLGQFTLERHNGQRWQAVTGSTMQHQRVRSLLACLISSPGRKLGREQAIDLLWPDLDFDTASHRLDKAVHSLRQLFEPALTRPATSALLLTEHATLQLADQSQVWVDADAFDALLARARASSDPGQSEQLLEEATLLYGGDYLPEEKHFDWTQTRRESLQRGWIGLLLELADLRIAREAISSAIDTLDRLLAIDPTNEAAVQRLILLLAQSGRRGEAMRIYQRFAAILKQEYKIAPLPETRQLYEAAQRGNQAALSLTASPSLPATPLPESEARPAMQVGRSNQSRFVGRDQELSILQQVLDDTEQSRRMKLAGQKKSAAPLETRHRVQCLLLMGDVGIGKTRLAEELGREAARRGWTVTWTRAYIQETSIPYRMWTETLRKAMARGLWQRQEIARHPLMYQSLRALLPELEDLLPPPDPSTVSPEQEQMLLWEAARSLLATISESAPLLIVLDDLQWADSSDCELLSYLVRQMRHQPILIAGTCRDIELPQSHPLRSVFNDLQREQAIQTIDVRPLTDEQIHALVGYLPEPLAQGIQSRAAGNPFFAEELARSAGDVLGTQSVASDTLAKDSRQLPDLPATLPDTIAAVLDLRLGRITDNCHRLLLRAAVLGGSFEFNALRSMESAPNADNEDVLLDLLEEALQAGMLSEEGSGTRITYHFWHPLLVSHLYDSLSAGRRASLHRRAAESLIHIYRDREQEAAAAISYHLAQGGAESPAIARYAELAGDRAYALSAYPEAVRHYRLALEHIGTLPASASADEHLRLANLLERLGECTRGQGSYIEARSYFERALEAREQYYHLTTQIDARYEAQIKALLWGEIGRTWYDTGDYENAQKCYSRSENVLNEAGITIGPSWANLFLKQSYVLWRKGNFELARQTANQALNVFKEVFQRENDIATYTFHSNTTRRTLEGDPIDLGITHTLLAAIAATIGESSQALDHLNTALAIYEQHDRQREIAGVCCNIGDAYLRKSEYILAQAALRRSLGIAERIGEISIISVASGNLGIIAARLGDLKDAEIFYRRGLALAEQVNDPIYGSLLYGFLATVVQDQGNLRDAGSMLCQALRVGRAMKFAPALGVALVGAGNLRLAQSLLGQENNHHSPGTNNRYRPAISVQLLKRAKGSLQHALALEGLEAETRTEGQLALAQTEFLSGEIDSAQQKTQQVIDEARRLEQIWLLACAERLMGSIFFVQGKSEEASEHFTQALGILQKRGMRLEYARTVRDYGKALLSSMQARNDEHQKGLRYLEEAHQVFQECGAAVDLQLAERLLAEHAELVPAAARKRDG